MKKRYPILEKLPFLLPVMWVVRIFSSFTNRKKYSEEAKMVNSIDTEAKERQIEFLKRQGL